MRRASVLAFAVALTGCSSVRDRLTIPTYRYWEGGGVSLQMDLIRPKPAGALQPAVLLIHGGGWQRGSRSDLRSIANVLKEQGYACALIDYRHAPEHLWPAQRNDAENAVKYLRANSGTLGIDPERIYAFGDSAGGHLAFWLGVKGLVRAVGSSNGVHDFRTPLGPDGEPRRYFQTLLGDKYPEGLAEASPILEVSKTSAPTYFIHGPKDTVVPVEQSKSAAAALEAVGVETKLDLVPAMDHGIDLQQTAEAQAFQRFVSWLRTH